MAQAGSCRCFHAKVPHVVYKVTCVPLLHSSKPSSRPMAFREAANIDLSNPNKPKMRPRKSSKRLSSVQFSRSVVSDSATP